MEFCQGCYFNSECSGKSGICGRFEANQIHQKIIAEDSQTQDIKINKGKIDFESFDNIIKCIW
jgi:hypothetical protein